VKEFLKPFWLPYLCLLVPLQVVHCLLVYDVIRRLVESFTERDVELLVLLLKST